jgi:HK97 family phage major capsid protein
MSDIATLLKQHTDGVELKLGEYKDLVTGIGSRLEDLEQKLARDGGGGGVRGDGADGPSWGDEFIKHKSDELAAVRRGKGRAFLDLDLKATITTTTGSSLIVPARDLTLGMPKRRMQVRSLLSIIPVGTNSVEYPKVITRPEGADVVAEGALKPESSMTFDLVTTPIRTIAHWIPASIQVLEDAPQLGNLIDEELRYGLALKEEAELLFGDGTGQHLNGMVTQATDYSNVLGAAVFNMIDVAGDALLQAALTEVPVDGIIMNPVDWMRMRMIKDGDGNYLLGNPNANVTPTLFSYPVVLTPAMPVDSFLAGSFASQTLYDRWEPRVEVSTEHADFFVRNLVAIRAEERIGLAVKRPEALIYGTFGNL